MDTKITLLSLIVASSSLLLIFLAYLIKYKKNVSLIAGYDEHTCKDKDGLANWVGGILLITGSLMLFLALLIMVLPKYTNIILNVYIAATVIGTMIAAIGGNKYKIKPQ